MPPNGMKGAKEARKRSSCLLGDQNGQNSFFVLIDLRKMIFEFVWSGRNSLFWNSDFKKEVFDFPKLFTLSNLS